MVVKFMPKATPFAVIAVAGFANPATVVMELPAAFVTLIVPPPVRFMPMAFEVVSASVLKVRVAPVFVPDQWTASPFAVDFVTLVVPKLNEAPLAAF
jgi:hypothetical protein